MTFFHICAARLPSDATGLSTDVGGGSVVGVGGVGGDCVGCVEYSRVIAGDARRWTMIEWGCLVINIREIGLVIVFECKECENTGYWRRRSVLGVRVSDMVEKGQPEKFLHLKPNVDALWPAPISRSSSLAFISSSLSP